MKSASKPFCLALASLALVFAACTKKPVRPDPSATMMNETGSNLNPQPVSSNPDLATLQPREGGFDANNQLRGAVEPVYFALDRHEVKADQRPKVAAAKAYLDKNPQYRVLLEGHCDWRGTAEYNLALGDRRANSVKKYLISLGVSADKIETVSKGNEDATKEGGDAVWAKDRRVEFVIVNGAGMGPPPAGATPAPAGP